MEPPTLSRRRTRSVLEEGELTGPDRETQEVSMLALHLLQSALVLVNTRLIDRILSEPVWAAKMTERTCAA
jgi:TnpA family transposase